MNNVVDRILLIRRVRFWLEKSLEDSISDEDLATVSEKLHELESLERDRDELAEIDPRLPNTREGSWF